MCLAAGKFLCLWLVLNKYSFRRLLFCFWHCRKYLYCLVISSLSIVDTQIASICWANVGKWLAWLADGWHWPSNIGPAVAQLLYTNCHFVYVGPTWGRWAKLRWANIVCQHWPNYVYNIKPTLAQQMIAIWVGLNLKKIYMCSVK